MKLAESSIRPSLIASSKYHSVRFKIWAMYPYVQGPGSQSHFNNSGQPGFNYAQYYSIDVECVASGTDHNSRVVGQIALVVGSIFDCLHGIDTPFHISWSSLFEDAGSIRESDSQCVRKAWTTSCIVSDAFDGVSWNSITASWNNSAAS